MTNHIRAGILEVTDKGYGFLRNPEKNFDSEPDDCYVSAKTIGEYYLREGCLIKGEIGEAKQSGQNAPLIKVLDVNNIPPQEFKDQWEIRDRIAIDPDERFVLETGTDDKIGRSMDLICPIGRGQRGLIVAPPRAGKTTILKHIAYAIRTNHPEVDVYAVLIDERPEEVTDFQRSSGAKVFYSSLDERPEKHMRIARMAFSTAIANAEAGRDVVVLIDSLTRMTRAFNLRSRSHGKTLSGGLDVEALGMPKRFFGAARNIRGQGSLSVIATILVETDSRMDEVIFQEFKGTGNMEVVLERYMAEKQIYPAISISKSGTRKEEKLLDDPRKVAYIRRKLSQYRDDEAMQELIGAFRKTKSNKEFLDRINLG